LVEKGAFDHYIEQAQDATDHRFGPISNYTMQKK